MHLSPSISGDALVKQ